MEVKDSGRHVAAAAAQRGRHPSPLSLSLSLSLRPVAGASALLREAKETVPLHGGGAARARVFPATLMFLARRFAPPPLPLSPHLYLPDLSIPVPACSCKTSVR